MLGIDPDERMAGLARRFGVGVGVGVRVGVEVATFEAWDSPGRAFDVVTAGQAWPWVDPPARQEELMAGLGAAIDSAGGSFTMGYTAVVATAARTAAA